MPDPRNSRRFEFWCYVGILSAAAAVSQAEDNWISFALAAAAIALGLYLGHKGRLLSYYARTPFGLLAMVLFTVDFLFYSRGVILTIAHIIILTIAIYLVTVRRMSDYAWLFVQGLILLSAAGASTFDISFLFYTCIFLLAAILFAYHGLMRQAADGPWRVVVTPAPRRRARMTALVSLALVTILTVGTGAYLLLPRFRPFGFTSPFITMGQPITGFSSEVTLDNGVGNILQNPTLVFRALISINGLTGESPLPLYWRGNTLVNFTGDGWRKTPDDVSARAFLRDIPLPTFIRATEARALGPQELRQEIMLEKLSADAMFVLPGIVRLESAAVSGIRLDGETADLYRPRNMELTGPFVYTAVSRPAFPDAAVLADTVAEYDLSDEYMALALDTRKVSPEIATLAEQVVGSPMPSPYMRVAAIQEYLMSNYEYTTYKSGDLGGATPVDDFLFRTRKGHCELFASAMALMLRAVNVPTRVVNGFYGGDYNTVGSYYAVAQSNAHSWTEVYFAGKGWYTFDATPAGEQVGATSSRWAKIGEALDYVKYRWIGTMAGYNGDNQEQVYARVKKLLAPVARPAAWVFHALWRTAVRARPGSDPAIRWALVGVTLLTLLAAAAFLMGAVWAWLGAFARFAAARLRTRRREYPSFYRAFLRAARRRGLKRRLDETPLEFAARAAEAEAVGREASRKVIDAYYRLRFSGSAPAKDELERLESMIETDARQRP